MIREGLTFDDVLLVPQHSTVESRSKVDLSVKLGNLTFKHPIIPANMKTITESAMAFEVCKSGGLAILHRFMPFEEQLDIALSIMKDFGSNGFGLSLGVKDHDYDNALKFINHGVRVFCIDIAHGDSELCVKMVRRLKEADNTLTIIAGNVATGMGARRLWEAGADVVKVGIGPGSLCTTRVETGNGVPQLTALMDVAQTQNELVELWRTKDVNTPKRHFPFIADGGIKNAGDVVKALCFADMVMVGNLFAGCAETPGEVLQIDGRCFKNYVGSSTHKTNYIEGVSAIVPTKGHFEEILSKLLEGLRSGCSYQGAHSLQELKDNPEFIRITNAGLKESHPHDVIIG